MVREIHIEGLIWFLLWQVPPQGQNRSWTTFLDHSPDTQNTLTLHNWNLDCFQVCLSFQLDWKSGQVLTVSQECGNWSTCPGKMTAGQNEGGGRKKSRMLGWPDVEDWLGQYLCFKKKNPAGFFFFFFTLRVLYVSLYTLVVMKADLRW